MGTAGSGGAANALSRDEVVGKDEGGVPVRPEEGVMDVEAAEEHEDDDIEAESMQLQMETVVPWNRKFWRKSLLKQRLRTQRSRHKRRS